jgi:hypothetical protein
MLPKCCAEHQKAGTFQRFSPTFQKLFLKRDLFDSLNGSRYPLGVGGWIRRRNGENSKRRKTLENAARTPSRLHALFGGVALSSFSTCQLFLCFLQ